MNSPTPSEAAKTAELPHHDDLPLWKARRMAKRSNFDKRARYAVSKGRHTFIVEDSPGYGSDGYIPDAEKLAGEIVATLNAEIITRHTTPAPAVTPATADEGLRRLVGNFLKVVGDPDMEVVDKEFDALSEYFDATPSVPAPQTGRWSHEQDRIYMDGICVGVSKTKADTLATLANIAEKAAPTDPCASELAEALEETVEQLEHVENLLGKDCGRIPSKLSAETIEAARAALTRYRQRSSPST